MRDGRVKSVSSSSMLAGARGVANVISSAIDEVELCQKKERKNRIE
jgi:hypothetical protein